MGEDKILQMLKEVSIHMTAIDDSKIELEKMKKRLEKSNVLIKKQEKKLNIQTEAILKLLDTISEKDEHILKQKELIAKLNTQIINLREPSKFEETIYSDPIWKRWFKKKKDSQ